MREDVKPRRHAAPPYPVDVTPAPALVEPLRRVAHALQLGMPGRPLIYGVRGYGGWTYRVIVVEANRAWIRNVPPRERRY